MKGILKIIGVGILCLSLFYSCKTTPVEFASDKFILAEVTADDTFKSLAGKYLNDPDKDWLISEFNKTHELKPGKNIIIPLTFFNKGGLKSNGYQIVPVLNYRQVSLQEDKGKVSEKAFIEQMRFLKENGYRVISTSGLIDFIDYKIQLPEKSIVLTFTSDINSFYEIAFPVIDSFSYKTTLFIDLETAGSENDKAWARIRELSKKGVDIQASADTSGLAADKSSGSIRNYFFSVEANISKSKKLIEAKTGRECNLYASPVGKTNNILTSLLAKNGYKGAFIDSDKANPFFVDKYGIHRTVMSGDLPLEEFKKKIVTFQKMDLN